MRKIEREMIVAVRDIRSWHCGNTEVKAMSNECNGLPVARVYLHGNHIANVTQVRHDTLNLQVIESTLEQWPTNTTISRLRALGADVQVRNRCVMLNGVHITTR